QIIHRGSCKCFYVGDAFFGKSFCLRSSNTFESSNWNSLALCHHLAHLFSDLLLKDLFANDAYVPADQTGRKANVLPLLANCQTQLILTNNYFHLPII